MKSLCHYAMNNNTDKVKEGIAKMRERMKHRGQQPRQRRDDNNDYDNDYDNNDDSNDSTGGGGSLTALHYASRAGHNDIVLLLLTATYNEYHSDSDSDSDVNNKMFDVNAVTSSGNVTALHRAAFMGHTTTVEILYV